MLPTVSMTVIIIFPAVTNSCYYGLLLYICEALVSLTDFVLKLKVMPHISKASSSLCLCSLVTLMFWLSLMFQNVLYNKIQGSNDNDYENCVFWDVVEVYHC